MNLLNSLAYVVYHPPGILLIVLLIVLILMIPRWPYNNQWGYSPIGTVLVVILIVWLAMGLTGCATNPDGSLKPLTPQQQASLQAIESFALNAAVNIGTQALQTGTVDTNTLVNSIHSGASVLQHVIATQEVAPTPESASIVTTAAIREGATTPAVKNRLAPEVAAKVREEVKKGANPKQAMNAAAKGMKKGADKLLDRKNKKR